MPWLLAQPPPQRLQQHPACCLWIGVEVWGCGGEGCQSICGNSVTPEGERSVSFHWQCSCCPRVYLWESWLVSRVRLHLHCYLETQEQPFLSCQTGLDIGPHSPGTVITPFPHKWSSTLFQTAGRGFLKLRKPAHVPFKYIHLCLISTPLCVSFSLWAPHNHPWVWSNIGMHCGAWGHAWNLLQTLVFHSSSYTERMCTYNPWTHTWFHQPTVTLKVGSSYTYACLHLGSHAPNLEVCVHRTRSFLAKPTSVFTATSKHTFRFRRNKWQQRRETRQLKAWPCSLFCCPGLTWYAGLQCRLLQQALIWLQG